MDPEEVTEEGTTVIVNEAPEVDTPETVVVEAAPESEAVEAVVVAETIDQAERIATLEAEVERLQGELASTAVTAEIAESTAETAIEIAIDAEETAVEETEELAEEVDDNFDAVVEEVNDGKDNGEEDIIPEDAIEPTSAKRHPLFRTWAEWRNK